MEPTNRSTYKKQSMASEFTNSCLGKLVILAGTLFILLIASILTIPSDEEMQAQMEDNIRECIQDNFEKRCDPVDEVFKILAIFNRNNKLEIYRHTIFCTARITNNLHPDGMREGIGIFGCVIPFLNYEDFLMTEGNVRGKQQDKLIKDGGIPEMDLGDNPMLKPYHYKGNPDD